MSTREPKAGQILEDIRLGLEEDELREKHSLSVRELQTIFKELRDEGLLRMAGERYVPAAVRRIQAAQIVRDIRSGMTEHRLMDKFGLSAPGLQTALDKLLDAGAISSRDLPHELYLRRVSAAPGEARALNRQYLDFDLPIVEKGPLEIEGRVRDITEKGVGVIGIPVTVGMVKSFLIRHEKFVLIQPFAFQAECRWIEEAPGEGECLAGFRITKISLSDLRELRKLIRIVTLNG